MFSNQIFCTEIKSPNVIQSWFKSNHDLASPIPDEKPFLFYNT